MNQEERLFKPAPHPSNCTQHPLPSGHSQPRAGCEAPEHSFPFKRVLSLKITRTQMMRHTSKK